MISYRFRLEKAHDNKYKIYLVVERHYFFDGKHHVMRDKKRVKGEGHPRFTVEELMRLVKEILPILSDSQLREILAEIESRIGGYK